ncbi:MAG TPA: DEAD/DEAH box helicase [Streptosporangiaceae bacterium]|nr:DEAD/DEAH box helicase [Streptosporangiaceae bacterium]
MTNTQDQDQQAPNGSIGEFIIAAGSAAAQLLAENSAVAAVGASELNAAQASVSHVSVEAASFDDFGVAESICAALRAAGITKAFPIQALTLPIALGGHDVIGQARTGTGKTLAFGIPLLQHIVASGRGKPSAPRGLVIVPTRELAIQVADDLRSAAARSNVNVVTLYGGRAYEPQIEALATVDIVVGTPGRLLDLSRQHQLELSDLDILVLDEADRMLDLGFLPDVETILRLTPVKRQTMLFSATMPSEVVTLAKRHLYRPTHIRAEHHDEPAHVPTTDQHVFRAHHLDKIEVLARVLQAQSRGLTIVFCRTRRACDQVTATLAERGFATAAVHGDLGQSQRERALRAFRSGKIDVLVATDVAARGLDVDDVTHVVNYECPEDEKAYLHRIGRTGRAGRTGAAVTFVDWQDLARWKLIDAALNLGHPEPLETYSTSEHLFTALTIPPGVTGALPAAQRGRPGLQAEDIEDIGETGRGKSRQRPPRRGHGSPHPKTASAHGERPPSDGHGSKSGEAAGAGSAGKRSRRRTRSGALVQRADSSPADGLAAAPGDPLTPGGPATIPASAPTSAPVGKATQVPPAKPEVTRRRRRTSRGAARGPAAGHAADGQHNSTRPASRAETRDIASDLTTLTYVSNVPKVARRRPQCPKDGPDAQAL